MSQEQQGPRDYYSEPVQPDLEDELEKLSPLEARLYAVRMATTPPRTERECATVMGRRNAESIARVWRNVKVKLGRDPLIEWKQKGLIGSGGADSFERLRNVSSDTLIKLAEMRAEAALRGITPEKIKNASVKDLTASYRELINSRQLLKGEPTQILQVNQRENLKRLFPIVMRQLQAKGITLEMTGDGAHVVKQIEPETDGAS